MQVPHTTFLLTHVCFLFYHVASNITLRRLRHSIADMPKQVQLLFEAAWILALAYFIAYLETVAISNVCDNIHQYLLYKLLMNFAFHLSGALSVINVLGYRYFVASCFSSLAYPSAFYFITIIIKKWTRDDKHISFNKLNYSVMKSLGYPLP